jgi:ABC-type glycerol-3-phosphate transport system substrate-binding protein
MPPNNTADPNLVAISFTAPEQDRPVYDALIAQFQQANPAIRVVFTPIEEIREQVTDPSDEQAFLRQLASQADTFATPLSPQQFNPTYLTDLQDLQPLIDADPNFALSDFFPAAVQVSRRADALFQLPVTIALPLIAYPKALWETQNIPPPPADWTWNDLFAIAAQLAQDHAQTGVYGTGGDLLPGMALLAAVQSNGLDLTGASVEQTRLDDPRIVAALQQVTELQQTGVISTSRFGRDAEQQITEQKAGMWLNMLGRGSLAPPFEVGQLPAPISPFLFFTEGYQMSRGTQHPQAAWQWLAFLSQQALPADFFKRRSDIGMAPARIAFATRSADWAPQWDAATRTAAEAYLQRLAATPAPAALTDSRLIMPLMLALDNIFSNQQTPEQAAQAAQAMLDQQLAAAPPPDPDPTPFTVAPPQLPATPDGAVVITFIPNSTNQYKARELAEAFSQQGHGITVTVAEDIDFTSLNDLAQRGDCFTALVGAFAGVEQPDVLDLQPLLDRDQSADAQAVPGQGWQALFHRDGAQYGLPLTIEFETLIYHQTAFTQAGLAAPHSDWTAAEWLTAARALRVDNGAEQQFGYVALDTVSDDVIDLLSYFDARLTSGAGATLQPALTDAAFVNTARTIIDGLRETSPHTRITGYINNGANEPNYNEMVQNGHAGMWFDNGFVEIPGELAAARASVPATWRQPDVVRDHVYSAGAFISAQTPHPAACWQWIQFLAQAPQSMGWGGQMPAHRPTLASGAVSAQLLPGTLEAYDAYAIALEQSTPRAWSDDGPAVDWFWLSRALDQALQGKDIQAALAEAQTLTENYFACQRNGMDATSCATTVDPSYNGW